MSMMDEIEKMMIDSNTSINFRTINLGGKCLYVEGLRSVVNFGEKEMTFQLKKGTIQILGEGLKIKYLDKSTCVIEGKIQTVVTK